MKVLYDRGQDAQNSEWKSWQFKSEQNPYLPQGEIENARCDLGASSFMQEFEGAWVDLNGSVFRNIFEVATVAPLDSPIPGRTYCFGIDWAGSGRGDYTAVAVLDAGARELVRLERWRIADYGLQLNRIKGLYQVWQPAMVIGESNSIGAPLIAQLRRDGIPITEFVTTNQSKRLAVEQLQLAFERRTIRIIPDQVLLSELQAFQATQLPSGMVRFAAAGGSHDDAVMSLILAWAAIETTQTEETRIIFSDDRETLEELGLMHLYCPPPVISRY